MNYSNNIKKIFEKINNNRVVDINVIAVSLPDIDIKTLFAMSEKVRSIVSSTIDGQLKDAKARMDKAKVDYDILMSIKKLVG